MRSTLTHETKQAGVDPPACHEPCIAGLESAADLWGRRLRHVLLLRRGRDDDRVATIVVAVALVAAGEAALLRATIVALVAAIALRGAIVALVAAPVLVAARGLVAAALVAAIALRSA